ncbi:hypothetical protein [Dietzia sp. UBA5065]|uniref:hypothetical protein n=1 Tax=Dietzia sp. UBA5065 TaxID=1946422 RepID=UPI0025BF8FB3|nr:hypothetical protein [Dietzia sp. UBA5065]
MGSAVVDQRGTGDDEPPRPPGVTVPPWLRTGPTADPSVPSPPAVDQPDAGHQERPREPAPARIRLGASRHGGEPPAAIGDPGRAEDLSSLPFGSGRAGSTRRDREGRAAPETASPPGPGARSRRLGLAAAAGVAVLTGSAVLGFVLTRGVVAPTGEEPTGCVAVSGPGRVAGDGPGSLDGPLEAVLAFDHAYYVERSAAKAFEAVSPTSRMTEEQLRTDGVDRVPPGTTHCVDARELSPTLLEVTLTETPPDGEPVIIRQRVRVAENPDGTWGIVSITPAG